MSDRELPPVPARTNTINLMSGQLSKQYPLYADAEGTYDTYDSQLNDPQGGGAAGFPPP